MELASEVVGATPETKKTTETDRSLDSKQSMGQQADIRQGISTTAVLVVRSFFQVLLQEQFP